MMLTTLFVTVLVPAPSIAPTVDPYEVPPGNPLWFPLNGLDAKGEVLHYTITFKKSLMEGEVQRPVDFILIERSIADQNPTIEIAQQLGLHMRLNISERTVGEWKNDRENQIMALFYNHLRDGDSKDWDNASVRIRFDYYLSGEAKEEGSPVLTIIIVALAIIVVVLLVVILARRFRRGRKEAVTFFNPEEGPFYVVRALIDSRVFYLDPDQYSQLYSSGRMNEFEFLGTSPRMGGTIIPPEGQGTPQGPVVLEAQALPDAPLQEAFANEDVFSAAIAIQSGSIYPQGAWDGTAQDLSDAPGPNSGTLSDDPQDHDQTDAPEEGQTGHEMTSSTPADEGQGREVTPGMDAN